VVRWISNNITLFDKRRTRLLAGAAALVACAAAVVSAASSDSDPHRARTLASVLPALRPGPATVSVEVRNVAVSRPIRPGFIGLSLEYPAIEPMAGTNPVAIDPVLVSLIRNLAPGQRPVLRIGGDSTDWAWWPVPGMRKPRGIRIVLTPRIGAVLGGLARAIRGQLILGIDLEADSRQLASFEARRLIASVGRGSVRALELGNEPELYGNWPWLMRDGVRILGRPPGYGVSAYLRDFRRMAAALPRVGLAGPALGGPSWIHQVGEFIAGEPGLSMVTVHTYPLQRCYTPLVSPTYPTISHLLAPTSSLGLAEKFTATVRTVHARGLPLRVDEMNNVSCGGADGVSNVFASALWALDTMFALARTGVDGVNIHTFQQAKYRLFRMSYRRGHWRGAVAPEYYGLLLFTRAAPPGARLLRTSGGRGGLRVWATRTPDRTVRVVLINEARRARVVAVRAPANAVPAAYEALRAPGPRSTAGVSLGGVGFGGSTETGSLPAAHRIIARPQGGRYVVRLPAMSAAMLTVGGGKGAASGG
jgi:hypothetical protein